MLYWLHVCICLRLSRSHVKKKPFAKKVGGEAQSKVRGGASAPLPLPVRRLCQDWYYRIRTGVAYVRYNLIRYGITILGLVLQVQILSYLSRIYWYYRIRIGVTYTSYNLIRFCITILGLVLLVQNLSYLIHKDWYCLKSIVTINATNKVGYHWLRCSCCEIEVTCMRDVTLDKPVEPV